MNSSMYTVFVARSIVHVKHVGGGGIVGHFIFFSALFGVRHMCGMYLFSSYAARGWHDVV